MSPFVPSFDVKQLVQSYKEFQDSPEYKVELIEILVAVHKIFYGVESNKKEMRTYYNQFSTKKLERDIKIIRSALR